VRVQASQINPTIGDLEGNTRKVLQALERARLNRADVIVFPELTLTGYPPEDLLLEGSFIEAVEKRLWQIAPETKGLFAAIGLPRKNPRGKEKPLLNSAAVFADGQLLGFKDKILLPTYDVFDERRFFEPGTEQPVFEYLGWNIGVTICEDAWQHAGGVGYTDYRADPIAMLAEKQTDLMLNLSASPYYYRRTDFRQSIFQSCARTLQCPVVLCNQVGANDQLIFDGHSLHINEKGDLIQVAKGFVEEDMIADLATHACPSSSPENGIKDLYAALVLGVRDYFRKQGFQKAILGLSGGVDSALVACIAKDALGAGAVIGYALPSRFNPPESIAEAGELARALQIGFETVPIDPLFQRYLDLLEPLFQNRPFDVTEENLQARIRGTLLMAFSNKFGAILLNTGNKSEMAMGYTTLYGDMCGGLAVLQDVTKTRVYELAEYVNRLGPIIPVATLKKAPSAELRFHQTDQDTLPPYAILDPILEDYLEDRLTPQQIAEKRGQPLELVAKIVRTVHSAEYKRRQAPIGLRVTAKAFSKGRNVPIVEKWG
jgi:NAD+ synthase (glutamine-hydrolysing)